MGLGKRALNANGLGVHIKYGWNLEHPFFLRRCILKDKLTRRARTDHILPERSLQRKYSRSGRDIRGIDLVQTGSVIQDG